MIRYIILLIFLVVWLYILHVTKKAKLPFWHFLWGSAGLFVIIFVGFKDVLTQPMANIVAAVAGIVGKMTGVFEPYYKYGIIFVESAKDSITLKIDFECSGIIEITAFLSLLIFATPTPSARINGTVIGPVVTPPESNATPRKS